MLTNSIKDCIKALFVIFIIIFINVGFIIVFPKNQLLIIVFFIITMLVGLHFFFPFHQLDMNKWITLIVFIVFAIIGPITESIMIYLIPKSMGWKYANTYPKMNIPIWLTMIFGFFSLAAITLYKCIITSKIIYQIN